MTNAYRAVVLALLACTVASCTNGEKPGEAVSTDQIVSPSAAAPGWQSTTVDPVTVSGPADWESIGPDAPAHGTQRVRLRSARNSFGTRGGVSLTVVTDPKFDAKTQATSLLDTDKAVFGATQVVSRKVVWPGAKTGWYLSYTAQAPNAVRKTAPHLVRTLILDLHSGKQAIVTATAWHQDPAAKHLEQVIDSTSIKKSGK